MKSLPLRLISAFVAIIVVLATAYFAGALGLVGICTAGIAISVYEYTSIAFNTTKPPRSFLLLFWLSCISIYIAIGFNDDWTLVVVGVVNCVFFSIALWITRGLMQNDQLLRTLAMGSLGLLYVVVLPVFVIRTLLLPQGIEWFFALMFIVFLGDTFAFFGGNFFGRHKLMPELSPKKTFEGAISGALGSVISGVIFGQFFLKDVPVLGMALMCLCVAFVAQSGDLFASLVKRVAQVKDSGHIMPGHGGLLDRLDGIFFSAPLLYAFARWIYSF